jgi:hypothetical protein
MPSYKVYLIIWKYGPYLRSKIQVYYSDKLEDMINFCNKNSWNQDVKKAVKLKVN